VSAEHWVLASAIAAIGLALFFLLRRRQSLDYANAPLSELSDELASLITAQPGRMRHYLPDLALKMFATQVLQYARTYKHLASQGLISWSFPVARAAFEVAEDLSYLAFAPTEAEYDRRGALAHVGAELSISRSYRLAREARPDRTAPRPLPERERLDILVKEWAPFRSEAETILRGAEKEAQEARQKGTNAWTLLGRNDIHAALGKALKDPKLEKVLKSWYDLLSDRSHPGLHSPKLDRHQTGHTFLVDGDEDNTLPEASVRCALIYAIHAFKHQYAIGSAPPAAI
jgi:hypothetical protein